MAYPNETPHQGTGGQGEFRAPQAPSPAAGQHDSSGWDTQTGGDQSTKDQAKDVAAHTSDRAKDVAGTARSEAGAVKDTAKDAGGHVVETAKQEGAQVLDEAKFQGRRLLDESMTELKTQAGTGQHKIAELVRSLGSELKSMSDADQDGMLSDYVARAQRFSDDAANWLESNEPDEVMDSVRRYAARNPWQFLAISAGVGFVGARLVRGLQAAKSDEEERQSLSSPTPTPTGGYNQGYVAAPGAVPRRESGYRETTFVEPGTVTSTTGTAGTQGLGATAGAVRGTGTPGDPGYREEPGVPDVEAESQYEDVTRERPQRQDPWGQGLR